jgi:hypothetical protein
MGDLVGGFTKERGPGEILRLFVKMLTRVYPYLMSPPSYFDLHFGLADSEDTST